jgi:hypothetical protein
MFMPDELQFPQINSLPAPLTKQAGTLALPEPAVNKQEAAKAQTFAYSPDQARQGLDIGVARRTEEAQRTYKTLQNQQIFSVRQEISKLNQQISDATSQAAAARGSAQSARSSLSGMQSSIAQAQANLQTMQTQSAALDAQIQARLTPERRIIQPYIPTPQEQAAADKAMLPARQDWERTQAFVTRTEGGFDGRTGKDLLTPAQRVAEQMRVATIEKDYYGGLVRSTANSSAAGFSVDPRALDPKAPGSAAAGLAEANTKLADLGAKSNALQPTPAATTTSGGQGRAGGGYGGGR